MEVRAVSSSKKITVELSINVDKIEYQNQNLRFFVIPHSDGTSYKGMIWIWEGIFLCIENATFLSATVSLMVSKDKVLSHCKIFDFPGES